MNDQQQLGRELALHKHKQRDKDVLATLLGCLLWRGTEPLQCSSHLNTPKMLWAAAAAAAAAAGSCRSFQEAAGDSQPQHHPQQGSRPVALQGGQGGAAGTPHPA
jgi:hypothetical protein